MQVYSNNAFGLITAELSSGATSFSLSSTEAARFQTTGDGDWEMLTLVGLDGNGVEDKWEVVKCFYHLGGSTSFSIARGQEGTTARTWPAGTRVEARMTAGSLQNIQQVLVSGENIRTVAYQSLVNPGNLTVHAKAGLIGGAGEQGFGVGVYPGPLPSGFSPMNGYDEIGHENYGNYYYSDGSVMVFIPKFYYKIDTTTIPMSPYSGNMIYIRGIDTYASEAAANAAGYALHRAFIDGAATKHGFFIDKYVASKDGTTSCKAVKNGVPISLGSTSGYTNSSGMTTGEGSCTGILADAVLLARARSVGRFNVASAFMYSALGLLSLAQTQAIASNANCAWYDATNSFPKGSNNNLADINDAGVTYTTAGDSANANKALTGSGTPFAKTTHNGQNCGVADLNGVIQQMMLGFTTPGTSGTDTTPLYTGDAYILKTSVSLASLTYGWNGTNDAWGDATNLAAKYDLYSAFLPWTSAAGVEYLGNNYNTVFAPDTSGINYLRTACGVPTATNSYGATGDALFGKDELYKDYGANMFPRCAGPWDAGASSGIFARRYLGKRSVNNSIFSFRAAAYAG